MAKIMSVFLLGFWLCSTSLASKDPMEGMEDPDLYEGDMVLTKEQINDLENGNLDPNVPLAATKTRHWPLTIAYDYAPEIASSSRAVSSIQAAIADYHNYTCLRFKKRTNENGYIYFYKGGGCSSPVGYYGRRNTISLASGCWYKGVVMHEIAHSLGFYHEQSRPDRDHYVRILWQNIPDSLEYNFRKHGTQSIDSLNVPYDFLSVMHYGRTAFGSGRTTIETIDPSKRNTIGRRGGFSQLDIFQMNLLYKCPGFTKPPPHTLPPLPKTSPPPTTLPPPPTTLPTLPPSGNEIRVFIRSESCDSPIKTPGFQCGKATIKLNGIDYSPSKRGHNIVVVNLFSGQITSVGYFDTHDDNQSGNKMVSFINKIPQESMVLVAIQDEGSKYLTSVAQLALIKVGGRRPFLRTFRNTFVLLGYKGTGTRPWVTQIQENRYKPAIELNEIVPLNKEHYIYFHLHSEGCEDKSVRKGSGCGRARIEVNGKDVSPHGRGLNVAIVDYNTGLLNSSRNFDTYRDRQSGTKATAYINGAPQNSIIAVVVQDEGSRYFPGNVMKLIGGTKSSLGFRSSYALLGWKGNISVDWKAEVYNLRGKGPSVIRKQIQLKVKVGSTSQADCDFQQGGMCQWMNVAGSDDFDWTRRAGSTPSSRTGPTADHTKGTKSGFYLYIETSSPRRSGDKAIMKGPALDGTSSPSCFAFWYHMYGATINELKVSMVTDAGAETALWSLKGQQERRWRRALITIPPTNGKFSFLMEGIAGRSYTGDIAIDDLKYINKSCPVRPTTPVPTTTPVPPTTTPGPTTPVPVTTTGPPTPPPPTLAPGSCGISPVPHSRVIGGKDAAVGAWPWQAALKRASSGSFFCGGSLINNQWILTAAHCISTTVPTYYKVTLGDHDRNKNEGTEQDFTVTKVVKNPRYHQGASYNNDAALLKLSRPVLITQRISPVCLPAKNEVVAVGTNCYITGWGKIRHPGYSHNILQQALMPIRGKQECAERLAKSPSGSRLKITDEMVCAGYTGSSTIISGCHGDSGGPLVCQKPTGEFQLHGAVSWGSPRCKIQERYTVFARVTAIRDWIDQTVRQN